MPEVTETPGRQEKDQDPPGAPRKSKHPREPQRNLRPKKLRYDTDINQESPASASKKELYRLLEARINNSEGTWVQCCKPKCNKWRCLQNVADPNEVPDEWYCFMNNDPQYNSCAAAEQDMSQEEFVDVKFFVGSIVWAKLDSYPWWPAMIDDDPDSCLYFCNEDPYDEDRVTHYHVTFLDKNVTRAWVREDRCVPLRPEGVPGNKVPKKYERAFNDAVERAKLAVKLPLPERIAEYCFINNYPPLRSASLRHTQTKSKQPRKISSKCKTTTQPLTSDTQPAKRPRGRPPKVRTTTQETMQQTQSASAATTSHRRASKPAVKGAKERTAASKSDPRPKYQSATKTIKKMQKRKDVGAHQKTVQCQEQTKSAAGAAIFVTVLQNLPSAQPQIQDEAAISVPVPNEALNPNLIQCLSAVQANRSPNKDQQPRMHLEAEKQGPASPIQASQVKVQVDTLPLLQRFPAATEEYGALGQLKPATGASATKLPNGTPVLFETPLFFPGGQTQESLEGIEDINPLIQFLDDDIGQATASVRPTVTPARALDKVAAEVPAKPATTPASGTFKATMVLPPKPVATTPATALPLKEAAVLGKPTAKTGIMQKTVAAKQATHKAPHQKRPFKVLTKESVTTPPEGFAAPKEMAITRTNSNKDQLTSSGSWMTRSEDSNFDALADPSITFESLSRALDKVAAEVPAKPATTPARGTFKATMVLPPKPVATTPATALPLKEAAALGKPTAKTGIMQKTVAAKQATHKTPHQKRLFKVLTKESVTTPPEGFAAPKEMPIARTNSNKDQLTSSGSWTTRSEDSDFDALADPSITFESLSRVLDKVAAEVPAKPATTPARGTFKATMVLPPKPVATTPATALPLKEAAALGKPAAKTGNMQKTVAAKQATHKAPHQKRLFKVPTKESVTTPPEGFAVLKEMPIARTNSNKDQLNSSGSWTTQSEDSDFDALADLSITFESLSSASQNREKDVDSDFNYLATVDCSQFFSKEE
ncbi:mucin-17 isoform X2 [Ixodes scapularis]|nr:mucin-17 isoform X2 [Ixodes scapularis]